LAQFQSHQHYTAESVEEALVPDLPAPVVSPTGEIEIEAEVNTVYFISVSPVG